MSLSDSFMYKNRCRTSKHCIRLSTLNSTRGSRSLTDSFAPLVLCPNSHPVRSPSSCPVALVCPCVPLDVCNSSPTHTVFPQKALLERSGLNWGGATLPNTANTKVAGGTATFAPNSQTWYGGQCGVVLDTNSVCRLRAPSG